ncbi:MbeB family mobilization protein [Shewanella sp. SM95]|uniref:MbeB family mobilization protein n=1 Tax=Shewanella sp. SM95 TaxID=2912812 RepID=UPI003986D439
MSKILDLAKDFEAKSKQQASATEIRLKREFERHEQSVLEALNSSANKIKSDIIAQNVIMNRLVLRSWVWIVATLTIALVSIQGVLWYQGNQIAENLAAINAQEQTLKLLQNQMFGIALHQNPQGERFILLPNGWKADPNWTVGKQSAIKLEKK